jgi:hypothetical protein
VNRHGWCRQSLRVCSTPGFPVAAHAVYRPLRQRPRLLRQDTTLGIGLVVLLSACAMRVCPPSIEADGQRLYADACAACHGVAGRGDGPVAAALKTPPPDLTRLTQANGGLFPRDLVIDTIAGERDVAAHGSREMPVWSQRFGPGGSGAPGVASVYVRRNLEMLTDYITSLQRIER